ncbi:MAG: lysophospholipase [Gammaproteobacteria bacterium]|nr:lysophospholipase [Gammaproteobacteria bacterium]
MRAYEIGRKNTVVFYLHGLRGHAFAQVSVLRHMVKNLGVRLITMELPGHGRDSQAQRCMVPHYHDIVQMIVDQVKARAGDAEQVVLMGYSFGGALMTLAANRLEQDRQFKTRVVGLVGISTAYSVGHNVPKWQVALVDIIAPLSKFLHIRLPRMSQLITIREMNVQLISADKSVQEAILNDRKVYKGRIPLYTSAQVFRCSLAARSVVDKIKAPVLLIHSKDDAIALAPVEGEFNDNVVLKLFETLRHNCIDGLMRESVVARKAITQFISDKL